MNVERFSEKARQAISDAARIARERNHSQVEVVHLLATLLNQDGGMVQQVIAKVGGNLEAARRIVNAEGKLDPIIGRDEEIRRVIQHEIENRVARGILD